MLLYLNNPASIHSKRCIAPCYSLYRHCSMLLSDHVPDIQVTTCIAHVTLYTDVASRPGLRSAGILPHVPMTLSDIWGSSVLLHWTDMVELAPCELKTSPLLLITDIAPCYSLYRRCSMLLSIRTLFLL